MPRVGKQLAKMRSMVSDHGQFGADVDHNRVSYLRGSAKGDVAELLRMLGTVDGFPASEVGWLRVRLAELIDRVKGEELMFTPDYRQAARRYADTFEAVLDGIDYEYGHVWR